MCQYEVIHFACGHAGRRLIKHCHFARNDEERKCMAPWSVGREWISVNQMCQSCQQQAMIRLRQQQQQQQQQQQSQLQQQQHQRLHA